MTVVLSTWTGVAGCGFPSSSKVVQMGTGSLQLWNVAPILALADILEDYGNGQDWTAEAFVRDGEDA